MSWTSQDLSKLDATASFHQVRLSEESQELTTFITPFGMFCFCRLLFVICSAPEYFKRQMSRILKGQDGVVNMIDDILVFGSPQAEHDGRLEQVLNRLEAAGVKLNKAKCAFFPDKVKFLGVLVSSAGISPDPEKIQTLADLKAPTNVSGVRRLLGMANHVGLFLPHLSDVTAPIRTLLKKSSAWYWGASQQAAFNQLKSMFSLEASMAKYDPLYSTTVSADAGSYGLGSVLLQDQRAGERRAVAYASRSLTSTEQRYSETEKEALAATCAVERFDQFMRGIKFDIESDHRPLLTLLGTAELDLIPPRIQRLRMRLMRFQYQTLYVPGF
ncbi:MAG: reverse transcriptase [Anaplasma sp.]|nr:reverse transcriptase [Anaplasma sp.]